MLDKIKDITVTLSLDYDGPPGNPFDGEEDLGLVLLRAKSSQIEYTNDEKGNHLELNLQTGEE